MIFFTDEKTGLPMGNPEIIPLSGEKPSAKDMQNALETTILSASGWRRIFAASGKDEDAGENIGHTNTVMAAHMANAFADFIMQKTGKKNPSIAVGIDSRPTGSAIADCMIRVLCGRGIDVQYLFITAAPEIMAYSRSLDGFVYISASHNPVGHNGVKFGLNDGGVIPGNDAQPLAETFKTRCSASDTAEKAAYLVSSCSADTIARIYKESAGYKEKALAAYREFTMHVISGVTDTQEQKKLFTVIRSSSASQPLSVVCDMNGSARTLSIDRSFLNSFGIGFQAINDKPRNIVHAIIPEPENLVHCAAEMKKLQHGTDGRKKTADALLGYMPDCDGDRGNIVYWDVKTQSSKVLNAQEVFALSVMAETAYLYYQGTLKENSKAAVVVNDPTSMRIEEIAAAFGVIVFRAEVGEANVVNLAREKRSEGYTVRILGEGSNGGNITHPAAVRDPLNTIFALIKLLILRDTPQKEGLFHIWCRLSGQENAYRDSFTFTDILETLPAYTTTGVSEPRAIAKITQKDHAKLKAAYQRVFESEWKQKKDELFRMYGICSYEALCNNGTKETHNVKDFSISGKGGFKILLKNKDSKPLSFIWMRGSGTEPVFRIMCDVKGGNTKEEAGLLAWHTSMLLKADEASFL